MDNRKKRKLKEQLEMQARAIVSQENEAETVVSSITSCIALLGVADGLDVKSLSEEENEQIYACLLGLSGKINALCEANKGGVSSETAEMLEKSQEKLKKAQSEAKELGARLEATEQKISELAEKKTALKAEIKASEKAMEVLARDKETLQAENDEAKAKIAELEAETKRLARNIRNFDKDIEALIKETMRAKEQYAELAASYKEFGRIQKGIEQDGFADMQSFTAHFKKMNDESEELIAEYNSKLSAFLADIEALQEEVKARSMPKGAVNA